MTKGKKSGYAVGALTRGLAVAVGMIAGLYLHKAVQSFPMGDPLVKTEGYWLTVQDVLAVAISFVVMLFGGRIHRFVRWIGVGMFGACVAVELYEAIFHKYILA